MKKKKTITKTMKKKLLADRYGVFGEVRSIIKEMPTPPKKEKNVMGDINLILQNNLMVKNMLKNSIAPKRPVPVQAAQTPVNYPQTNSNNSMEGVMKILDRKPKPEEKEEEDEPEESEEEKDDDE